MLVFVFLSLLLSLFEKRILYFSRLFFLLLIDLFMTDASGDSPVTSLLPLTDGTFLSGHVDGKIRRYDIKSRSLICIVNGIAKEVVDC